MKMFDVEAPDGRIVRLPAESIEALKPQLAAGYTIVAEAFGVRKDGAGGYSIPLGGKSLLAILLQIIVLKLAPSVSVANCVKPAGGVAVGDEPL